MASNYRAAAAQAAQRHGLDPQIFLRQIQQESGFNPSARSPAGAMGIAQIMPATARGWGVNPMDPNAALDAAARNMAKYVRSYGGSYAKALAAYNAGPGAVSKYGGVPPYAETQKYVKKILGGSPVGISDSPTPNLPNPLSTVPQSNGLPARNNAAILTAAQSRAPGESFTRAAGKAALIQQAVSGGQTAQPQAALDPAISSDMSSGMNSIPPTAKTPQKNDGTYAWAQALAKKYGLRLASTYRSPAQNAAVGGSRTSAHMTHGAATDFAGTPAQMRALALAAIKSGLYREVFYDPVGQWDNGKFSKRGIGGHPDHVHITR